MIRASFGRSARAFDKASQKGDIIAVPFGRYLLLDRIKRGGMAEVYRAKVVGHEGFEKIVAIKRILPHLAQNEDFVTMFIDEAKIVSYLNHQNICPVIELGRCEDGLYIVMEYIWGRDLRQILNALARAGRLMPTTVASYIAARIAEGLDYAHRRTGPTGKPLHLVHRDISPQNVLVSFDGEVKIIDFGIASASQRSTETRAGTFKGKFAYMSPEQARGQNLDRRSDIFAAGILLHEMITGSRLFAGKTDLETLDRVRSCEVPPPSRPFEQVPPELVAIAMKALARHPDDRYQAAGELQEALDRFLLMSGELASASRLGTWICINFSEDAAKALVDQERAARARPPGGTTMEDDSESDVGMPADALGSGRFQALGSESSASASVSTSQSAVEAVSRSVSAVADDVGVENGKGLAKELELEVDEEAFGAGSDDDVASAPEPAPRPPTPASGSFAASPGTSPGSRPRPVRPSTPSAGMRPTERPPRPPSSGSLPAERPTRPPSSGSMRVERPPRPPSSGALRAERPTAPPPSGSYRAERPTAPPPRPASRSSGPPSSAGLRPPRMDSSVNVAAQAPTPEVRDQGNARKRRRLDPVEVEYSPWTRFVPNPNEMKPPPDANAPPAPDDPGVRVSATIDPGAGDELVIFDEPPPGCEDGDGEPGTDPDGKL